MAKKQTFGDKTAAKAAQRKMAKVIMSHKTNKGSFSFRETTIDQDKVNEYISGNRDS
ncbi:MAG: DUF4295 domain-containing protein [Balneolales bacterium]